jgi:ADP-ribosylglycohydrolase
MTVEYAGRSGRFTHGDQYALEACRHYATLIMAAINLGIDTDITATIYKQLAGGFYRYKSVFKKWLQKVYAYKLLVCICQWLYSKEKHLQLQKMLTPMSLWYFRR